MFFNLKNQSKNEFNFDLKLFLSQGFCQLSKLILISILIFFCIYPKFTSAWARGPSVTDGTPKIDEALTKNKLEQVLELLSEHLITHPKDVQAQFKYATTLTRLGRYDQAIATYQQLIDRYPEIPEVYNNFAALQAELGNLKEAQRLLELAISAYPNYALAYRNLGDVYLRLAQQAYGFVKNDGQANKRAQQISKIVDLK